jgi:hypothetical protein
VFLIEGFLMEQLSHSFFGYLLLALTFLTSMFVLYCAFRKPKTSSKRVLFLVIGLQFFVSATGYVSLETGEIAEEKVEGIVEKKFIQSHESSAEIMTGISTLALILSVTVLFVTAQFQLRILTVVSALGLISGSLGLVVRTQGIELVRSRVTAPEYDIKSRGELEKIPGSFSSRPVENESLMRDENDYGGAEEPEQTEDDNKQED